MVYAKLRRSKWLERLFEIWRKRGDKRLKLRVLGSSSSGNSYALILDSGEILAIEAGCKFIDFKKMIDWKISNVVGCIVTHEHLDHSYYIKDFMRSGIPVYTAFETQTALETITGERTIAIPPRRPQQIGSFTVTPFNVSHDTEIECYGYLINGAVVVFDRLGILQVQFLEAEH